jgi:2',3'-cyclic-nucleotide 2'-phosphodiesterase (5'-nucleotidase family)
MKSHLLNSRLARAASLALIALTPLTALSEGITILHVGDQESWLISAQGNLRDSASQAISFYGGVDRLATVMANATTAAQTAGRFVLKINAGDSFLPGPRLTASFDNLATAHPDGGQDFYDAIALRQIGFDASIFGNHEFDLGPTVAARFADVSNSSYLSMNLNFGATPEFAALETAGKVGASKIITTPGGKKVGIIGLTTPLLPIISSPGAVNLTAGFSATNSELQNLQALLPHVQTEVNELRTVEGCTLVILVSHLQNAQNERTIVVPGLTGVDLVVSGGGHELMTDPDDLLINGGVAATFTTHPIYANDLANIPTPIVTGDFGNRYVGEVNLTISDTTGLLTSIDSTRMRRVSGAAADADRVTGNPTLNAQVVAPVLSYIAALNAQIIGTTGIRLNGDRAGAGTPGNYAPGIRKSETNLGNLVADANRFAGGAEVAIQNGGGIRTSVAGPGNLSVGDTFNVLPFTNLIKTAPVMNATQLKDILEHGFGGANTTPSGGEEGRFPQVSGMKVFYDTSASRTRRTTLGTGDRVRRVVLDDGTVLIDNGAVVNNTRTFSFATIDFTANGGDGYPFAANNVVFANTVFTVTYQEALKNFIETPKADGGLQRVSAADGDEVTANVYDVNNVNDLHGRLIDLAIAAATPGSVLPGDNARNTITGTTGDDVITGLGGADTITGGAGGDTFVYTNIRDAGDVINDFTPHADRIQLTALLTSIGYVGTNPFTTGHIRVVDGIGGVSVQYDLDGTAGALSPRPLVTLRGVTAAQLVPARDFIY